MTMNQYGLTFRRWLAAAGRKADKLTRRAWSRGEDPTDWRSFTSRLQKTGAAKALRKAVGR